MIAAAHWFERVWLASLFWLPLASVAQPHYAASSLRSIAQLQSRTRIPAVTGLGSFLEGD